MSSFVNGAAAVMAIAFVGVPLGILLGFIGTKITNWLIKQL